MGVTHPMPNYIFEANKKDYYENMKSGPNQEKNQREHSILLDFFLISKIFFVNHVNFNRGNFEGPYWLPISNIVCSCFILFMLGCTPEFHLTAKGCFLL
jgi:hypothetical protein